jgi:tRNA nucleotidyltransferase/poly(A) polymerase
MTKEIVSTVEIFSFPSEIQKSVYRWKQIAERCELPIYIKGGAIRDSLINSIHGYSIKISDLDLVVHYGFFRILLESKKEGYTIVERRKRKKLPMYRLSINGELDVDLGHLLGSIKQHNELSEYDILRQDAMLSDLDINTFTYNLLTGKINDPLQSLESIYKRQINLVSERSLFLDPATIFRCLKVSYKTGFSISPRSTEIIRKNIGLVSNLKDRFLQQILDDVLKYTNSSELVSALDNLGILKVRPEIFQFLDK